MTTTTALLDRLAETEAHLGPPRGTDWAHIQDAADAHTAEARATHLALLSLTNQRRAAYALRLAGEVDAGRMTLDAALRCMGSRIYETHP